MHIHSTSTFFRADGEKSSLVSAVFPHHNGLSNKLSALETRMNDSDAVEVLIDGSTGENRAIRDAN